MPKVSIDYSDWLADARRRNVKIESGDDMLGYIAEGWQPRKVGECTFALIQAEEAPPELLPDPKRLLSDGTLYRTGLILRTRKERLEVSNSKRPVYARWLNHRGVKLSDALKTADPLDGGEGVDKEAGELNSGFARIGTDEYGKNAEHRLLEVEPGRVKSALLECKVARLDVKRIGGLYLDYVREIIDEVAGYDFTE